MINFTESIIEQATIDWIRDLGSFHAFGPEIAFDGYVCSLARLRDGLSMPQLMRWEVRVKL